MKKQTIWLILILLAGTLLRIYNLTAISLWHDEAFSALLIRYPWHEMFYRIGLDVHPPLYYILLRFWADIFGHGLGALRGFSVFFSVATIYAIYLFVQAAFKKSDLALAAAFLIAINPFQIEYVTEARMYTLGTFLIVISAYFLVRAFENQALRKASLKFWLLFALSTSAAMYTHYYLFFSVFGVGLFAVYYAVKNYGSAWHEYKNILLAYLLVLLGYLPWLKTFLFQFHQVQANYWIPKIDKWSIPLTNWHLITGASADPAKSLTKIFVIIGVLFSLYMIYRLIRKEQSPFKWLVLLALVVPFLGSVALSIKQSIYLDRYFLFAALFYTVALVLFIFEIKTAKIKYILLAILALVSIINWLNYWRAADIANRPGMAAAAAYLNNNVEKNDLLDVAISFEYFNFKYYNQTGQQPMLYTPGSSDIKNMPAVISGSALLDNQDLLADLQKQGHSGSTVWMLWTNAFGGSKPATPKNWREINEKAWQDLRPYPGTAIVVTEYKIY